MPLIRRLLIGGAFAALGAFTTMRFLPVRAPVPYLAGDGRVEVQLAGRVFLLEVADTPERRAQGLAGRDGLAASSGMFFRFSISSPHAFWMRGMRIPVDIVWLRDGIVTGIVSRAMPPPPGTPDADIQRFMSPGPINAVIELAAGRADDIGLTIGQRAEVLLP